MSESYEAYICHKNFKKIQRKLSNNVEILVRSCLIYVNLNKYDMVMKGVFIVIDKIFSNSKLVEKALDASWLRNDAISQNLANVDTPGYKKKTVPFEQLLNDAMSEKDIDNIDLKMVEDNSNLSTRLDGNNVDIESETADEAKNTIKYNTLIQSLNSQFSRLRSAIREGK